MNQLFFQTLNETVEAIAGPPPPQLTLGPKKAGSTPNPKGPDEEAEPTGEAPRRSPPSRAARRERVTLTRLQAVVRIVVSLAVLSLGAYLVVSGNDAQGKIGASFVGTVVGYWLR